MTIEIPPKVAAILVAWLSVVFAMFVYMLGRIKATDDDIGFFLFIFLCLVAAIVTACAVFMM